MTTARRRLLATAAVAATLAVTGAGAAAATEGSDNPLDRQIPSVIDEQFGSHDGHTYVPATSRPPVPARPVAVQAAGLPAWTLAGLPLLGAAAGGLAGLRRRWSDDA